MTAFDYVLWVALPWLSVGTLLVGSIWRFRVDQFRWTTRSSQFLGNRVLHYASPLFHYGILFVAIGHFMGLIIPKSWTEAVGVGQTAYHLLATIGGSIAAVMTIVGLIGLLWRRRTDSGVFRATTANDKFMYLMLALPILLGTIATVRNQIFGDAHGYDYRETISPWLRGVFLLHPDPGLMADVPLSFKLHIIAGFLLFMIWPFTRLVHAMSAPVGYVTRPYVVYRSRTPRTYTAPGDGGWVPVSTREPEPDQARASGA
ncbi:respiratory nitrate reductase subunit gamma [Corynebacterium sphenisci]|uniref:respiratory nitrate reductase subunit gamma n=1 Tax=Corynebacterium sphenisci TaxID=191493 RepID=UPI0026E0EF15|nr:respiratory nitrate reductase subunit gamma [Corynebacterium sphenisci]MDO5730344.1 respiratory nitrate reductase subunit gamma [Corynebacterium sphenisci]